MIYLPRNVARRIKAHEYLRGIDIEKLNLGGGFGIRYVESDDPIKYEEYIKAVSEVVKAEAEKHGLNVPIVILSTFGGCSI